jgi:predicted ferric reductase
MKNHLVVAFLLVATFVSCLLPFREINTIAGSYTTLFGTGTSQASVKFDSGIDLKIPLLSIVFILVSYVFLNLKYMAWKIIGLVIIALFLLFQFLLYFIATFRLDLFGPKTTSEPSIGFFTLLLLAIFYSAFYIFNFVMKMKDRAPEKIKFDNDLLDEV